MRRLLAALLLLALPAACTTAPEPRQRGGPDLAAEFAAEIFPHAAARVSRWEGPFTVSVADPRYRPFTAKVVEDLATAVPFPAAIGETGATLIVASVPEADIERMVEALSLEAGVQLPDLPAGWRWDCHAGPDSSDGPRMIYIVDEAGPEVMPRCIFLNLMVSLGLPGWPGGQAPRESASLTETDRRLLDLLYDPLLADGIAREQAMPIVRQMIAARGW